MVVRRSWRSLRATMLAVAVAAVAMSGLREFPTLRDCYLLWQGAGRAQHDVELIGAVSGLDSAAGRRAVLNAHQAQVQADASWRENLPSLAVLACGAAAGLWLLGLAFGGALANLGKAERRGRTSPGSAAFYEGADVKPEDYTPHGTD